MARRANRSTKQLHEAVLEDDLDEVNRLLEAGADVNSAIKKSTPLHEAYTVEMCELLVAHGADLKALNSEGRTPLHSALFHGENALARYLIEQGFDIQQRDSDGSTLLHSACYSGTSAELVRCLLDRGLDAAEPTKTGSWTTLHYCAVNNFIAAAPLLIEHGAAVNAVNDDKETPLHIAARFNNGRMARLFLERGANPSLLDKKKQTPMSQLLDGKESYDLEPGTLDVARALLDHGAEATAQQMKQITRLQRKIDRQHAKLESFDWGSLEERIATFFGMVVAHFAAGHGDEVFCGFCLDCNVQEGGQMLACLDTEERLDDLRKKKVATRKKAKKKGSELSADDLERLRWSPGDWPYTELADTSSTRGWRSAIRPIKIDGHIEPPAAEKLLECASRAVLRMERNGAFEALSRTDDFAVFVIDHNEMLSTAQERMARARAPKLANSQIAK